MLSEFGRYLILKKIAVGGMAEIFLARRVSMGQFSKFVVLKRLSPEYQGKRSFERLFLNEAKFTGRLSHPNIVQVHDIGQVDGSYFMAMEYIHGISSAEMMSKAAQKRKPVPLGVALGIVKSTARALDYCGRAMNHEGEPIDLLHHDISPHNIQIRFDGEVKLLDFGVATLRQQQEGSSRRGKFAYMSPEAFRREELDQRSDLFSLGVVLYELTMGRRLFKGKTQEETKEKAEACVVPQPRSIHAQFPERLEELVLRALSVNRDERFSSFAEMLTAIDHLQHELKIDCSSERVARYLRELYGEEIERRTQHLKSVAARAEVIGSDSLDEINTLHTREQPPINLTGKPIDNLPGEEGLEPLKTPMPFAEASLFGKEVVAAEVVDGIDKEPTPADESRDANMALTDLKERDWDERERSGLGLGAVILIALLCSAAAFWLGQSDLISASDASVEGRRFIIHSTPTGASVVVNGIKWGETPFQETKSLSVGEVTIELKKSGFKTRSELVKLEGDSIILNLDLTSKTY